MAAHLGGFRKGETRSCEEVRGHGEKKLPGQDLNLELGDQNPLCCQLHHRVWVCRHSNLMEIARNDNRK